MTDSRFPRDHLTRRNAPSYSALVVIFSAIGILASLVYAFWLWGTW